MSDLSPVIAVVDDDPSVRKAIERLLRAADLTVSVYQSAEEYLLKHDPKIPGCLILDLAMPGVSGLELQTALVARGDVPPIIFLSGNAEIPDSVQAMKRGAVEFLTKPVDDSTLIDAVNLAIVKDRTDRVRRAELAVIQQRLSTLTSRECEVLSHVVSGKLNKQIAAELGTVEKTIKVHRARVMEKMRAGSLAELVHLAELVGISSNIST